MSDLHPCPSCHRHVMVRETRCPFCSELVSPPEPRSSVFGRMSRAMVFASATLAACGGKAKPAEPENGPAREHHGGGGCSQPDQSEIDRLEQEKQQAKTDDEKRAIDEKLQRAKMPVCMPYGAPPARRRVV